MLDVEFLPRANLDRQSIVLHLAFERQSAKAAEAAVERIDKALQLLRQFPDMGGHFTAHLPHDVEFRQFHAGPYVIFYKFNAHTLIVCRIWHERQNIDPMSLIDLPE